MVKLKFDAQGYVFQKSVKSLRASFLSALEALADEVERAKDDAFGYQEFLEQGGEWLGEHDEEGNTLWDQTTVLEMRVEDAEEAEEALCKAFAIALYHQWERSIRRWTGAKVKDSHVDLVDLAKAKGLSIDPRLDAVRDLVNTLKHDSDKCGKALQHSWPEVFSPDFQAHPTATDWYRAVLLRERHVLEAFAIIAGSGPTVKGV